MYREIYGLGRFRKAAASLVPNLMRSLILFRRHDRDQGQQCRTMVYPTPTKFSLVVFSFSFTFRQARSQRPPSSGAEGIQGGRNFWKQILTDNFIVAQKSCKRVWFFVEKRRNSFESNVAVRLFSNVR